MEIEPITFEPGIRARLRNDSDERNPDGTTFDVVFPLFALHNSPLC